MGFFQCSSRLRPGQILLSSQSMGTRIWFKSCFYFYHSHLSFYGFNRPSMTSLPPSEVFAVTYFLQTSFLTKNKKFPSNKARPSISEFYFSVVTRWSREQAGGTHNSVSFPHFHVSSQCYRTVTEVTQHNNTECFISGPKQSHNKLRPR